jgi:site-specific DNA recombinase
MQRTATAGAPVTRALIYARYSTTLQSGASIEDQVRICSERADREGWEVAGVFTDAAISGAVRNRPGLNALLAAIAAGDVVVAESIDRLSRDQADIADLFKRVRHADVRIVTLSEGELGKINVAVNGLMADLYRDNLADKTRRGQTGRVLAGFNPGGLAYGYRRVARFDDRGEPVHGLREVDEEQAAIVRRIFAEFVDGRSPREIAKRLNADGIVSPSGGKWSAATINGDRVRGNGILQNDLYRGLLVFNRTRRTYDPDSRKKRIQVRPASNGRFAGGAGAPDRHDGCGRLCRPAGRVSTAPGPSSSGGRSGCCRGSCAAAAAAAATSSSAPRSGAAATAGSAATVRTGGRSRRTCSSGGSSPACRSSCSRPTSSPASSANITWRARRASIEEEKARRGAERRRDAAGQRVERLLRAVTDGGSEFAEIRDALVRARAELAAIETELANASAGAVIALHPGNRGRVPPLRRRASRAARGSGRGPRLRGPSADPVADRPGHRVARSARARHVHCARGPPGGDPRPRRRGAGFRSV